MIFVRAYPRETQEMVFDAMHPTHALILISYLWGVFTLVYILPINRAPKEVGKGSGIYQVFPADRIDEMPVEPTAKKEPKVIRIAAPNWFGTLSWASYFSLLSAVNIGFERFTPGDWVRRLQGRKYSLQAVGWVRCRRSSTDECVSSRNVGLDHHPRRILQTMRLFVGRPAKTHPLAQASPSMKIKGLRAMSD